MSDKKFQMTLGKSWIPQQQTQRAFPFFIHVSSCALIRLTEQPIRVISLGNGLSDDLRWSVS